MPITCIDVDGKDGELTFSIDCPLRGQYQLAYKVNRFTIVQSKDRRDMSLFSSGVNGTDVQFVEYYERPSLGYKQGVMCYLADTGMNYVTSYTVWNKVVALLSKE